MVTYDLSADGERRRVDVTLAGYGFRVHKSVYECRLSPREFKQLVQALQALKLETGTVRAYRVGSQAASAIVGPDHLHHGLDDDAAYVL